MKCPYRKVTIEKIGYLGGTEEQFGDCYGTECPLYVPEKQFNGGIITPEYCIRASQESNNVK